MPDLTNGPLNVAIVGSGGREHALAWKLSQSPRLGTLYALPGNPGMAAVAECRDVKVSDADAVVAFCRKHDVGFVVIGPEDPLAAGLADVLLAEGIRCFGPGAKAARLEADKAFAKELMQNASIPTADSRTYRDAEQARQYVRRRGAPLVVKATGLAKGKGVAVCNTEAEAIAAVDACLRLQAFGKAGATVLIEDKLDGVEASVLALIDGSSIYVLPPCQDHKPVGEGNTGPMTGGMGAFCPSDQLSDDVLRRVEAEVFIPTLDTLARDKIKYRGCLYAGLMLTKDGPFVLEFNVRFGDPETQPLMMRWKGDLLEALLATSEGRLAEFVDGGGIDWHAGASVGVVMASEGYPGKYENGRRIEGIADAEALDDVQVFQAGTMPYGEGIVTAGGRVLCVTARGDDIEDARAKAYAGVDRIDFKGATVRRDIGLAK